MDQQWSTHINAFLPEVKQDFGTGSCLKRKAPSACFVQTRWNNRFGLKAGSRMLSLIPNGRLCQMLSNSCITSHLKSVYIICPLKSIYTIELSIQVPNDRWYVHGWWWQQALIEVSGPKPTWQRLRKFPGTNPMSSWDWDWAGFFETLVDSTKCAKDSTDAVQRFANTETKHKPNVRSRNLCKKSANPFRKRTKIAKIWLFDPKFLEK